MNLHDLQIPLVFGVTGHRDLSAHDTRKLESAVLHIFEEFKRRCPSTPLILLSPLAEGADRLVARVAQRRSVGAKLIVPLPMRQELYEEDFKKHKSLEDFRELLARADSSFTLPHLAPDDRISHPGPERNAQYQAAGEFIVRHCQNLIALWDGAPSQGEGGTADIIALQLEGLPRPDLRSIEPPEGFPVHWVVTPHAKSAKPTAVAQTVWLFPVLFEGNKKHARAYYDRIFERVNEFNRSVSRNLNSLREQIQKSKSDVLGDAGADNLPADELMALERYAVTDSLAISFQKKAKYLIRSLHIVVFFSFVIFAFFAHAEWMNDTQKLFLLGASGGALAVGAGLLLMNWRFRIHINHQDFRVMAEGLRVALFWKLAGISDSVADHYLWNQRSELDWIRSGIRGWALPPSQAHREHNDHTLRLVFKKWVENQQKYFARQQQRNEHAAHRNERIATFLIFFSALTGIVLFISAKLEFSHLVKAIEVIIIEATLAAGALLHNYSDRMAYARHAKQYSRMQPVFTYAADLISDALGNRDLIKVRHLLRELGQQALAEHGDWVLIHRERPVKVPHP